MEPIIKLKYPYIDDRGLIQSLVSLDEPKIQSAVIIESKKRVGSRKSLSQGRLALLLLNNLVN